MNTHKGTWLLQDAQKVNDGVQGGDVEDLADSRPNAYFNSERKDSRAFPHQIEAVASVTIRAVSGH